MSRLFFCINLGGKFNVSNKKQLQKMVICSPCAYHGAWINTINHISIGINISNKHYPRFIVINGQARILQVK